LVTTGSETKRPQPRLGSFCFGRRKPKSWLPSRLQNSPTQQNRPFPAIYVLAPQPTHWGLVSSRRPWQQGCHSQMAAKSSIFLAQGVLQPALPGRIRISSFARNRRPGSNERSSCARASRAWRSARMQDQDRGFGGKGLALSPVNKLVPALAGVFLFRGKRRNSIPFALLSPFSLGCNSPPTNDAFARIPVPAPAPPGFNGGRLLAISQFLNHVRYNPLFIFKSTFSILAGIYRLYYILNY